MLFSELHSDEWTQFREQMVKVFQRMVNYPLNGVEPRMHGKLIWMVLPGLLQFVWITSFFNKCFVKRRRVET